MTTMKVAISMPEELVREVDMVSKEKNLSRSGYITGLVKCAVRAERREKIKASYDKVFSDPEIITEQNEISLAYDRSGSDKGQEW